ncbi:MAG: ABC transporter permease [Thiofilum sp.]|uniref:ABC transporter permease n=1 Tax=Thiofilum sp. TaxID=2212733 RepID=UPI0025CB9F52|nr:ABC transporter permease [Thiofilum sp.]MBK8453096.1 ABC transporter permease [Thiofilum sp.]
MSTLRIEWDKWGRLASLGLFFVVWQLAALYAQTKVLPTPIAVFARLGDELVSGELLFHLSMTLMRVAFAFALAMFVGVVLGIMMGAKPRWNYWLDSLLILFLNIPALVLIILCYVWFGLTDAAAILAVALNKIPTVAINLREGTRAVDKGLLEVAQVYHVSRWDTFWQVYWPQLYPYLFAAGRNGLALIWKIVLVVELLGRSNGVGFQLGTFFQYFDITGILAYTIAFVGVVLLLESTVVRPLEKRLNRWRA